MKAPKLPLTPAKTVEPLRPIEGPINHTVNGRNFEMDTMVDSQTDERDRPRADWISERFMMEWRRILTIQNMRAKMLQAIPQAVKMDPALDNERDEYFYKISREYVQLENVLVAKALRLSDPVDAEFVKSLKPIQKLRIITIQDQLNGFDIVRKVIEMENLKNEAERQKKLHEKMVEERAKELLREKYPELAFEETMDAPDRGLQQQQEGQ